VLRRPIETTGVLTKFKLTEPADLVNLVKGDFQALQEQHASGVQASARWHWNCH